MNKSPKIPLSELVKMMKGELPMKQGAEKQIVEWKERLASMYKFDIDKLMERVRASARPRITIPLDSLRPMVNEVNLSPAKITRILDLELGLTVWIEKGDQYSRVIGQWKKHLGRILGEMPFEPFEKMFELVCHDLILDCKGLDEARALEDMDFVNVLREAAVGIKIEAEKDIQEREARLRQEILPTYTESVINNLSHMHNIPFEIRDNYEKAQHDLAYLKRLDEYDLNRVYEYAQGKWMNSVQMAAGLLDANPNYPYPDSYRNGHELDYWLDHEHQTQRCKAVKQEIERLRMAEKQSRIQPEKFNLHIDQPLISKEKNLFNNMPLEEVTSYFTKLATEKSSNGRPFLTIDEVEVFVARAFAGKTGFSKLSLNFAKGEKQFVWRLFYEFYVQCTTNYLYEPNTQCKSKYIDLLADHFTNFTKTELTNNFHKSATRKWPITN